MTNGTVKKTLEERINNVCRALVQQAPDIIYHCTTANGLLGIIGEKTIWATNILYLNDSKEFRYSLEITQEKIKNKIQDFRNNENILNLLDSMGRQLGALESVNIYVVSFSKNGNQLSQWRAYGEDSYGYSLGFITERLITLAQKFYLKPCIYCRDDQENIIEEIINSHIEYFQDNVINAENINIVIKTVSAKFTEDIIKYSPIIKHESFYEECEWRLISRLTYENGSIVIPVTDKDLAYRPGKSMIIPYFKCKLDDDRLIAEVFIGPTAHGPLAQKAVEELLDRNGFVRFVVHLPSIPYQIP